MNRYTTLNEAIPAIHILFRFLPSITMFKVSPCLKALSCTQGIYSVHVKQPDLLTLIFLLCATFKHNRLTLTYEVLLRLRVSPATSLLLWEFRVIPWTSLWLWVFRVSLGTSSLLWVMRVSPWPCVHARMCVEFEHPGSSMCRRQYVDTCCHKLCPRAPTHVRSRTPAAMPSARRQTSAAVPPSLAIPPCARS